MQKYAFVYAYFGITDSDNISVSISLIAILSQYLEYFTIKHNIQHELN